VLNDKGLSDFSSLKSAMRWQPSRLIFVAFDLLQTRRQGFPLRPLIERKAELEVLIGDAAAAIQFSQHIQGARAEFYAQADRMGFEGMVSKREVAPYRSDRTTSWLKIKCYEETDYEVASVLRAPGKPLVAYMVTPDKERRYVGGAFITLNEKMRERLWQRVQKKAPAPKGIKAKPGTEWLKPGLVGKVRQAWQHNAREHHGRANLKGEQQLRHATLRDKG
jgi:ATP-dependent DNA ligase